MRKSVHTSYVCGSSAQNLFFSEERHGMATLLIFQVCHANRKMKLTLKGLVLAKCLHCQCGIDLKNIWIRPAKFAKELFMVCSAHLRHRQRTPALAEQAAAAVCLRSLGIDDGRRPLTYWDLTAEEHSGGNFRNKVPFLSRNKVPFCLHCLCFAPARAASHCFGGQGV